MQDSDVFLRQLLDTLSEQIVVIDGTGDILFVNHAWNAFAEQNSCAIDDWKNGINYLTVCDDAAHMGDEFGLKAARGIRKVISSEMDKFYFEYPCHSPEETRWFMMRVSSFNLQNNQYFVISHQNITLRKLAEEEVLKLSRIDGLTEIANRRYFDECLKDEWKRCLRLKQPLSIAMIDLDHFKLLNDRYGHQAGDECLKMVGITLKQFIKRPGDICARYGGEEFVVVLSNTELHESQVLLGKIIDAIEHIKIPNEKSPIEPHLTMSVGLATIVPSNDNSISELISVADKRLFLAKEKGRNQMVA